MDETIIGWLPGGIELRTAHGADGKFVSGGGHVTAAAGYGAKAKQHALFKGNYGVLGPVQRHEAYEASQKAHEASAHAHSTGHASDHAKAKAAHEHAEKLHQTIAGNKHIGGTVRVAHGKEAAAHREHAKAH